MVCREVWDYDDEASVATLVDFALNCWGCDAATHPGCAGLTGRKEAARAQLEKVNGMSAEEVEALLDAAGEEWARRSQVDWDRRSGPRSARCHHPSVHSASLRWQWTTGSGS